MIGARLARSGSAGHVDIPAQLVQVGEARDRGTEVDGKVTCGRCGVEEFAEDHLVGRCDVVGCRSGLVGQGGRVLG